MEADDPYAFALMGNNYYVGEYGYPQNNDKAVELWRKAGKLGYTNLGTAYANGNGAERDAKKAKHHLELAAMEGCVTARNDLGADEYNAGNYDRALKHYMIAVRGGFTDSVKYIQQMYMNGHATKQKIITQMLYDHIRCTSMKLRVTRGTKLQYSVKIIVIINAINNGDD